MDLEKTENLVCDIIIIYEIITIILLIIVPILFPMEVASTIIVVIAISWAGFTSLEIIITYKLYKLEKIYQNSWELKLKEFYEKGIEKIKRIKEMY